jgi:hypothetical protein
VKWFWKYGRKVSWIVKRYGKYRGKASRIVKRYGTMFFLYIHYIIWMAIHENLSEFVFISGGDNY